MVLTIRPAAAIVRNSINTSVRYNSEYLQTSRTYFLFVAVS